MVIDRGVAPVITREPGGTRISEQVRAILPQSRPYRDDGGDRDPALLAARAQHVAQIIRPALEAGKIVLCDRFYDSTYAYRATDVGSRSKPFADHNLCDSGIGPGSITLSRRTARRSGLRRRETGGEEMNRLDRETLAFHQRVREGYLALLTLEPHRWRTIDATGSIDAVQAAVPVSWLKR